jgi:XTP/dITP diphosphohydrolase
MKISEKVAGMGFDWAEEAEIWAKFAEERQEFLQETDPQQREAEFGDMLFTLLQIARWHKIDPDRALSVTNAKFARRFALMEQQADRPLDNYTISELEALWQVAKQQQISA